MARAKHIGRRPGVVVVFPGKDKATSFNVQPALKKAFADAEQRTGRSRNELLHLSCFAGIPLAKITEKSFQDYIAHMKE